jgi:hypothetical protein
MKDAPLFLIVMTVLSAVLYVLTKEMKFMYAFGLLALVSGLMYVTTEGYVRRDSLYSYSYKDDKKHRRDRRPGDNKDWTWRDWSWWLWERPWYQSNYGGYVVPGYFVQNDCHFGNCEQQVVSDSDFSITNENMKTFDYSDNKKYCKQNGMTLSSNRLQEVEYTPFGSMHCKYDNGLSVEYKDVKGKTCAVNEKGTGVICGTTNVECPTQISMTCKGKTVQYSTPNYAFL